MISIVLKHILDLCSTKPFFLDRAIFHCINLVNSGRARDFYETVVTKTVTVIITVTIIATINGP